MGLAIAKACYRRRRGGGGPYRRRAEWVNASFTPEQIAATGLLPGALGMGALLLHFFSATNPPAVRACIAADGGARRSAPPR